MEEVADSGKQAVTSDARQSAAFPCTLPLGLDTLPAASQPDAQTSERALRIFVRGFSTMEQRLLEGTVRLSLRRLPRLELVPEQQAAGADLVLIDGSEDATVEWFKSQRGIENKTTIWIDSRVARPGHTLLRRPVQWSALPMILARALEQFAGSGAKRPEAEVADAPRAEGAMHLLVVDDSLAVRNHLRSLLEARGLKVTEADCVRAAIEAVAADRFGCVLMDVLMPDMDGYEGCKRIKRLKASVGVMPVVMLTSKSSPFDRIRGKMAGCDAYLTKPVAPDRLYEVLSQYTGLTAAANASDSALDPRAATEASSGLRRSSPDPRSSRSTQTEGVPK